MCIRAQRTHERILSWDSGKIELAPEGSLFIGLQAGSVFRRQLGVGVGGEWQHRVSPLHRRAQPGRGGTSRQGSPSSTGASVGSGPHGDGAHGVWSQRPGRLPRAPPQETLVLPSTRDSGALRVGSHSWVETFRDTG